MSYELIGIVILGISQVTGFAYLARLTYSVDRSFQEQLRRNLGLETKFQKWPSRDDCRGLLRTGRPAEALRLTAQHELLHVGQVRAVVDLVAEAVERARRVGRSTAGDGSGG